MFWPRFRLDSVFAISLVGACFHLSGSSLAQIREAKPSDAALLPEQQDPRKRPLSTKQQKAAHDALKVDSREHSLRKWPETDVSLIITQEERDAFNRLSNEEEREAFVEIFWQNRDPTPETMENEYRDEYYQRVAYANERFGSGIPGSKTDRGRIYILHGPPDEIESHPSGGTYDRPFQQGGGTTSTFPFEQWRYRYLEGVGQDVVIEFVDACLCGDYHITIDPGEKDALAHTPMGRPLTSPQNDSSRRFEALQRMVDVQRPPKVRFNDLREVVISKINYNFLPFDVLANFVRATGDSVLVPITVQIKNRDITFVSSNGVERGAVNIFGRVTTLTGHVAQMFEDSMQVDVPHDLLAKTVDHASVYWKALPLRSGRYLLEVVAKDVHGNRAGTWRHELYVPDFSDDRLRSSSLIVADRMESVPSTDIGKGNFVIGDTYVRPPVPGSDGKPLTFHRGQRIGFWMQVYNLGIDEKTHKPSTVVDYDVVSTANGKSVIHSKQSTSETGNIGAQLTLQKTLSAADLQPGRYELHIRVTDEVSKETIEPTATFSVE